QAPFDHDQVSTQKLSNASNISSTSEKSASEKNGQGLIQEISHNFNSPEISFTP
ncbi:5905_t:CDS:1, partial [Funneliformis geosporum]